MWRTRCHLAALVENIDGGRSLSSIDGGRSPHIPQPSAQHGLLFGLITCQVIQLFAIC
ncbi:MAG: hypothetical protein AAGA75_09585 [Cyanobacteria bacterium P01_E01_bin.6]